MRAGAAVSSYLLLCMRVAGAPLGRGGKKTDAGTTDAKWNIRQGAKRIKRGKSQGKVEAPARGARGASHTDETLQKRPQGGLGKPREPNAGIIKTGGYKVGKPERRRVKGERRHARITPAA